MLGASTVAACGHSAHLVTSAFEPEGGENPLSRDTGPMWHLGKVPQFTLPRFPQAHIYQPTQRGWTISWVCNAPTIQTRIPTQARRFVARHANHYITEALTIYVRTIMSYLRGACGVSRMDGVSNESVCERFGMCHIGVGKKWNDRSRDSRLREDSEEG